MDGSCFKGSAIIAGSTASPHSTIISVALTPKALHILPQRSPNLPPLTVRTFSPGERKLDTEPSIAPVPLEAIIRTSLCVWNNHFKPLLTSSMTGPKSGERWCTIGYAILRRVSGGTGVGPGANKYFFIIVV